MNDFGHRMNDFGHRMNDFGHRMNDFGHRMDAFGPRLNDFGKRMNAFWQRMNDCGQRMNNCGQRMDYFGQRMDYFGQRMVDHDQKTSQVSKTCEVLTCQPCPVAGSRFVWRRLNDRGVFDVNDLVTAYHIVTDGDVVGIDIHAAADIAHGWATLFTQCR